MKHLLTIFFIATFFCASAQTNSSSGKLTKQDSINVFVKRQDAFIDTLISTTSLKQFRSWLDESVSAKTFREGTLNDLWVTFINVKVEEWVRKNKIVVPKN